MSSRVRRCGGCGGPLTEAADDRGIVTCSFCGTVNEVSVPAPQPIIITVDAGRQAATGGKSVALAIIVAVTVILTGVAVYHALNPAPSAIDVVQREGVGSVATRPLAMTDLPTLNERRNRRVHAPPPPGGWNAFDPVAAVPWASEIAQAWAPDARLTRIDLGLVSADGTADLTGERQDTIAYRFVSPARIAQWARIADSEVNAAPAYELFIRLGHSEVVVYVHSGRPSDDAPPPPLDSLPLRDVLARARESKRFPSYPLYTGFLIHSERTGWIWYLQSLSRRESIPQVRARDAAVYPW